MKTEKQIIAKIEEKRKSLQELSAHNSIFSPLTNIYTDALNWAYGKNEEQIGAEINNKIKLLRKPPSTPLAFQGRIGVLAYIATLKGLLRDDTEKGENDKQSEKKTKVVRQINMFG
jgi:hypothetical protein